MFIQPVSMKCTQEQYEKDLKIPLLEMGYNEIELTEWHKYPYLVTNYTGFKNRISNMDDSACEINGRYFIDHYNPELFLALAAMTEIKAASGDELGGLGEWITAKDLSHNRYVKLTENNQFFNDAWRKATKEELIAKFTKKREMEKEQDLRDLLHSGDIVELRNGEMGIVIDARIGKYIQFKDSYTDVINYDGNLRAVQKKHDIIKIRKIFMGMQILPTYWEDASVVWERTEPKEVTLQELIEKAGYKAGEIKVKVQ